MHKTVRTTVALAVVGLGMVGGGLQAASATTGPATAPPPTASSARAPHHSVCHRVRDCSVMGRFDVNGDGRKDQVGLVNHDRDGSIRNGHVTVRAKTGRDRVLRQRVGVTRWRGPVWYGKASIDGRAGKEIVLGADRDRYFVKGPGEQISISKGFHVIAFKPGADLIARDPSGARLWWLTGPRGVRSGSDSAVFYHEWGWWRQKAHGQVRIQKRWLSTGGAAGVRSKKTVWVWRHGDWHRRSSGPVSDPLDKNYGGWHVRGLPVW
jgi:hypothetical protein